MSIEFEPMGDGIPVPKYRFSIDERVKLWAIWMDEERTIHYKQVPITHETLQRDWVPEQIGEIGMRSLGLMHAAHGGVVYTNLPWEALWNGLWKDFDWYTAWKNEQR